MRKTLAIALLLGIAASGVALAYPEHRRFLQPNLVSDKRRAVDSATYPYFEFAPGDGGLGTTPCACVNPTGAKGETLTMTRAGTATCLKSESFSSGIVAGDMVTCAANTVRLVYADATTHQLGIWAERLKGNFALRSLELDNAAWTNTATVTANTTAGPDGTTTAETLTDGNAGAVLASTQVISTSTLSRYAWTCFVKGSTAIEATMSMTGTGNAAGDCTSTHTALSTTSFTRIGCNSPAAYASGLTAVTVSVGVGDADTDTGDLIVTGCQMERDTLGYPSSFIPTAGTSVNRNGDNLSYSLPAPYASPAANVESGCVRACIRPAYWPAGTTTGLPGYGVTTGTNGRGVYRSVGFGAGTTMLWSDGTNEVGFPTNPTWSATASSCWVASYTGVTRTLKTVGGTTASGAFDSTWGIGANAVQIGWGTPDGTGLSQYEAVISQVRFDPVATGVCD